MMASRILVYGEANVSLSPQKYLYNIEQSRQERQKVYFKNI